ncbi:MAG: type IV conjugative transfer system protein TraL [Syntrophales bacterium]|jgi:conjugal transfer pilus assembly protein TraL|nr:type IV conjugative transfer system protein TraL [Syntrophales bacterium]
MTNIARYIDDPPQIFFWQVDEFIVFGSCFALGTMAGSPTIMIALGCTLAYLLSRVKAGRADGFFMHILYWSAGLPLKGCPPSYIRTYIE